MRQRLIYAIRLNFAAKVQREWFKRSTACPNTPLCRRPNSGGPKFCGCDRETSVATKDDFDLRPSLANLFHE